MKRFPWITVTLAALSAAAALVPARALEYDRARVAAGEVWRLLTGQMVHWTPRMAAYDLGMLLGLGVWLEVRGDRRHAAAALALGGALTALAVHTLSPGLLVYRGSSGVASALFVLAAVRVGIAESSDPRSRTLAIPAILAVALFLAKALFESLAGQTLFAGPLPPGVRVVPLVHLLGGLCGLAGAGKPRWTCGFPGFGRWASAHGRAGRYGEEIPAGRGGAVEGAASLGVRVRAVGATAGLRGRRIGERRQGREGEGQGEAYDTGKLGQTHEVLLRGERIA
jgi:rhomboid family GlyGly-CTERM serine protease